MKLSNLKNIIKEELKKIKEGTNFSNFSEGGYNEYMNRGGMLEGGYLNEEVVCECCGAYAAAKAGGDCMDGGGTQSGTACAGGGYTIHCNDMVIGPPVGVGTGTNTGTGKPGLGTDMMAPRRRF
tara:strand:- start:62 stop:433 length:372 start_codon:yes stop_codon:yes gene_type:complete